MSWRDASESSRADPDEAEMAHPPVLRYAPDGDGGDVIRPIVAKIPVVMKPGAYEVYAFHVENNTLSLTQQRNVRGPVEGRAPTKLVRVE